MKQHYFFVPLAVLGVAIGGSLVTEQGLAWYNTLQLPSWTPPGQLIGLVWTLIFLLTAISSIVLLTSEVSSTGKLFLIWLFLLNALLNIAWSIIFFWWHDLSLAVWEGAALALSVIVLIVVAKPLSKAAAWMLVPYLAWVCFAIFITLKISQLNPYW